MQVEWKPIPSCPGYEASSDGNIRKGTLILKTHLSSGGYRCVGIHYNNDNKTTYRTMVSHLVSEAFFGPCALGTEVHHINGIRTDDSTINLQYVKSCEHRSQAMQGENHHSARLTTADVLKIREQHATINMHALAYLYNVSTTQIWRIIQRKSWKHI